MRLISSRATFWYKRVFPVLFVGAFLLFGAVSLLSRPHSGLPPELPFMLIPVGAMVFIYFFFLSDLVDEVWDDGDALVLRNRGTEGRVTLSSITNVKYSVFMNPPRVVLSFRHATDFGDRVAFCAPLRFIAFTKSPVIVELIARIDRARVEP